MDHLRYWTWISTRKKKRETAQCTVQWHSECSDFVVWCSERGNDVAKESTVIGPSPSTAVPVPSSASLYAVPSFDCGARHRPPTPSLPESLAWHHTTTPHTTRKLADGGVASGRESESESESERRVECGMYHHIPAWPCFTWVGVARHGDEAHWRGLRCRTYPSPPHTISLKSQSPKDLPRRDLTSHLRQGVVYCRVP
jgi:hypothetical protein